MLAFMDDARKDVIAQIGPIRKPAVPRRIPLRVSPGPLRRESLKFLPDVGTAAAEFPTIRMLTQEGANRTSASIQFCFDAADAVAGIYDGVIEVYGSDIEPLAIKATVTVQSSLKTLAAAVALSILLGVGGAFYRWAVDKPAGTLGSDLRAFGNYLNTHWVNVGFAIGAAVGVAFVKPGLAFQLGTLSDWVGLSVASASAAAVVIIPANPRQYEERTRTNESSSV